jgi:hypothetical protein
VGAKPLSKKAECKLWGKSPQVKGRQNNLKIIEKVVDNKLLFKYNKYIN